MRGISGSFAPSNLNPNIKQDTMTDAHNYHDDNYSGSDFEVEDSTASDGVSRNGNSDNGGSLSPASTARVEELVREINAIRKGKAKRQSSLRSPRIHPSSLQYFLSLSWRPQA